MNTARHAKGTGAQASGTPEARVSNALRPLLDHAIGLRSLDGEELLAQVHRARRECFRAVEAARLDGLRRADHA